MFKITSIFCCFLILLNLSGKCQEANGLFRITVFHKADLIPNTSQVIYRYSYTNGIRAGVHVPLYNKNLKVVRYAFDIGSGYVQFVKNSSSAVINDSTRSINTQAPKQTFVFNYYTRSILFYAEVWKRLSQKMSCQLGYMFAHSNLSTSNLWDKPVAPGYTSYGGGPGSYVWGAGYYYSNKINVTTFYGGISYYFKKNFFATLNIGVNYNNDTFKKAFDSMAFGKNVSRFPSSTRLIPYIDHTMPNSIYWAAMISLSYKLPFFHKIQN